MFIFYFYLAFIFYFTVFFPGVGSTGNITYGGVTYHCDLCPGGKACESTGLTGYSAGVWEGGGFIRFVLFCFVLFYFVFFRFVFYVWFGSVLFCFVLFCFVLFFWLFLFFCYILFCLIVLRVYLTFGLMIMR
jgi:hypothetical protein